MSISDLDIQFTIQLAHAEIPGFQECMNGNYGERVHGAPRIGWIGTSATPTGRAARAAYSHPLWQPPRGWRIVHRPSTPCIYLGVRGYLVRDT